MSFWSYFSQESSFKQRKCIHSTIRCRVKPIHAFKN